MCIELDFLPIWLAKISANIISDPEVQKRLVDYQLNAKDVLAKAFLGDRKSYNPAPESLPENLKAAINLFTQNAERLQPEEGNFALRYLWKQLTGTELPNRVAMDLKNSEFSGDIKMVTSGGTQDTRVFTENPKTRKGVVDLDSPFQEKENDFTRWYTTSEIADLGGVSIQLIAGPASSNGLRTKEFSRILLSKKQGVSGLAVISYNEEGKDRLLDILAQRKYAKSLLSPAKRRL